MTIEEALDYGRQQLAWSTSPWLDARLLLEHVLKVDHSFLVAHCEDSLAGAQRQEYLGLVARAAGREPIPYLIGYATFYGLELQVTPSVLIPRPETELLVDSSLKWAKGRSSTNVVDVGTGSGCVAIALALHLPSAHVEATDISPSALEIALNNAREYGVQDRIRFHCCHLLDGTVASPDLIVANLPYVADDEWTMLDDGVKWYEPDLALKGGPGGLELIGQLLNQASARIALGGAIFMEIGWRQGARVRRLARSYFPNAQIELLLDYAGNDRILTIKTGQSLNANRVVTR